MHDSLWAYIGISILVIVTPGPDTVLTVRNTLLGGRSGGIVTALGVVTGQLIWALATSAGLAAILVASGRAFQVVKLAGAAYLILLGVRALFAALRARGSTTAPLDGGARGPRRALAAYRQGAVSNLGNPKMAVFFVSIFPQFAPPGHATVLGMMSLGVVFSTLTLLWLAIYAVTVSGVAGFMRKSSVQRVVEGIAGTALIVLGARLVTERE